MTCDAMGRVMKESARAVVPAKEYGGCHPRLQWVGRKPITIASTLASNGWQVKRIE